MSKDVLAATIGGGRRMRMIGLLTAAVIVAGLVPWVSADTAQPHGWGHGDDRGEDKLLFFASDGMQQTVEKYADQGVTPGFRDLLRHGAQASDHGLLTQAPPNTGAGWFTLATGAWPARPRLDQQHVPHQRRAVRPALATGVRPHRGVRPRRPAGRDARPGGRARRQEGRPDRVGRRPRRRRSTGRRVDFRNFRSGRGVATNYIAPADDAAFTAVVRPPVRPSGRASPAGPRSRQAAPTAATGWTDVPALVQPGEGDAPARARRRPDRVDKYGLNAYIYDSRNDGRTRYDRVLFSTTKDGDDKVADLREGEWADVKVKIIGSRPRRQDRRVPGQGRAARRRPLAGPPLPHLGDARDRVLAELAGRAGLHRQLRGLRRRAASRPRRPATSPCSRPASSARRPTSSRASTGRQAYHPLIKYVLDTLQAGPRAGRLPGHRRGPAPVPRPGHAGSCRTARTTRPTTTSQSTARRTAASSSARRSSATPTRAPTRRCGSRRSTCATAT